MDLKKENFMIAWGSSTPPGIELDRGEWIIYRATERVELPEIRRCDLQAPPPIRKGFRTPPINPGKRIKSKKRRSR
jgi:hypothetical protein